MNKRDERQQEMESILAEWLESGESLRGFARRSGYSFDRLRYWSRRLAEAPPVTTAPVSFQPVHVVADEPGADSQLEVVFAGTGDRLVLRGAITREIVSTVLAELRSRC